MTKRAWATGWVFLICGVAFQPAFAEQGCPDGFTPNAAGTPGQQCIPIGGQTRPGSAGPADRWETRWGAIATDKESGKVGIFGDTTTRRKAETGAIAQCQRKGGADCKLQLTYYNQCGVLAWGNGKMSTASAPTVEEASELALNECERVGKNCEIFFSDCSYAKKVR
ncbi:DUF4189 domain-containing protein [Achromobacter anxifer]|uniref:DUF4189 domain-containing protein n=1 Tax=Achromobacter anxifer TaxID=1287737 RepID=UPI001591A112|nr:DUF4189 domain-containing protein [Achromobacter anxifer]